MAGFINIQKRTPAHMAGVYNNTQLPLPCFPPEPHVATLDPRVASDVEEARGVVAGSCWPVVDDVVAR